MTRCCIGLLAATAILTLATAATAAPVSVDVAKACNALAEKAYPPKQPGNPAAGLKNGTARDATAYFRKCVDNGGKVDAPSQQPAK